MGVSGEDNKLITVIVPVYNIKDYVEKCIVSLVNQTYSNLEIILVDDGSTDGSGDICERFAVQDNRIIVLHKPNGGLSDGRNYALDRAKGELIAFVDGDDWIHPQMYELMYATMKETDADIVTCRLERRDEGFARRRYRQRELDVKLLTGAEALCDNIATPLVVAFNKLYRREIFADIRYPKGKLHEDEYVIHRIFYKCARVAVTDKPLYFYVAREGSITSRMIPQRIDNALEALGDRVEFSYNMGWDEVMSAVLSQYCDYCIDSFVDVRAGRYPALDDRYMDILWQTEHDMLAKYPDISVGEKYRRFAISPEEYDRWLIDSNGRNGMRNMVKRAVGRILHIFRGRIHRV